MSPATRRGSGRRHGRPNGRQGAHTRGRRPPHSALIGRAGAQHERLGQNPCRSRQGRHTTRTLCPRGHSLREHYTARRLDAASHTRPAAMPQPDHASSCVVVRSPDGTVGWSRGFTRHARRGRPATEHHLTFDVAKPMASMRRGSARSCKIDVWECEKTPRGERPAGWATARPFEPR
jgi:hypothetical protein